MTTEEQVDTLLGGLPTFWLQDENSNNYKFFLSIASVLSTLKTNIDGLEASIQISTSSGTDLDDIGKLFGFVRDSDESDSTFRNRIQSYWQNYNRGGLKNNIINAFAEALGLDSTKVTITETTPAVINLAVDITDDLDYDYPNATFLSELANSVKAAGTKVVLKFGFTISGDTYEYDDSISISTLGLGYVIVNDTYQMYSNDVLL